MVLIIGYIAIVFGLVGVIISSLYTFLEIFIVIKSKTSVVPQSVFVRLGCGFLIMISFMLFWSYVWISMMP